MEEYEIMMMQRAFKPRPDELSAVQKLKLSIESHVANESEFLEIYADAIGQHDSPLVRFILQLILADEEKHHEVLHRIVARLEADLTMRVQGDAVPAPSEIGTVDRKRLIELTDRFIEEERDGIAKSKELMTATDGLHSGLLTMLLRGMVQDSEKHVMMLQFMRKQLQ
jgi:bacterioferritin (cytochrome b1)